MLNNQDIICIANTTWFGEYTKSTVQLLTRLAKNNSVLFVEYPFTWKDIFTTLIGKQKAPVKKMLGIESRFSTIKLPENKIIYHLVMPPVLPIDFIKNEKVFNFLFNLNLLLYKRTLTRVQKKLNFKQPIVITAYNAFYGLPLIGKLNEKLNVYYCYDGLGTRRHGKRIFKVDEEFSKKVDIVITTSDFLNNEKKQFNPNSFVVKNGVDFNVFNKWAKTDLIKNKRKTIGYIGSLDRRFDIDTVEYAVKKLQSFDFHITGNLRNLLIKKRLEKYSNVYFFDPVKPDEVPKILTNCDVGIIPYIMNDINKNIYPLKINEYLAVGVPVVMNAFANLPEFNDIISIATNKAEFVEKLTNETNNDSKVLIAKRINYAKSNSWDYKAYEFGEIIEKFISKIINT
jgi:teichuronic acid biosynthesis glycosyltransferase TuaH